MCYFGYLPDVSFIGWPCGIFKLFQIFDGIISSKHGRKASNRTKYSGLEIALKSPKQRILTVTVNSSVSVTLLTVHFIHNSVSTLTSKSSVTNRRYLTNASYNYIEESSKCCIPWSFSVVVQWDHPSFKHPQSVYSFDQRFLTFCWACP